MFRKLAINFWKFFLSGNGMTIRTGRYFGRAAAVGGLVGLVTVAFHQMMEFGHEFIGVERISGSSRWLLFLLPAAGAIAGSLLIKRFSSLRHARGTDSAVYAYHHLDGVIPPAVVPVKSIASVVTVESGGSAGYEGPITLIGAACGSFMASILHLDGRARRILMAAGLAAGISALFRAPLAGAIFGAEIFYSSSDLEYDVILPSFVASAVSYTVFACFVGWQPLFTMPDYAFENGIRLFPYIILAFVVTLGARFYITFFRTVESFFTRLDQPAWIRVAIGGLITGAIGFCLPDVLGPGYAVIQRTFSTPDASAVVDTATRHWPLHGFLLFFFLKTIATSCTVGSGGSGGVFAPALVCGGALGAAVGIAFEAVLPSSVGIHPASFALVGMAGFVASAVRCPLTAIVMVAEISGNHALLLPTMWVCGIAFWLNNGWSLYRSQVHNRDSSPVYL
jgi:CIC family chloride channel protein